MTHPGAAQPGEPGWQHHPGAASPPPQQRTAPPQQVAAPAPTLGGTGPGHSWAAQRGQGRAAVGTAYTSQTAAAAQAARPVVQARSVARAGTVPAPRPAAEVAAETAETIPVVRPHRRQPRIAGIHIGQLVAWQAGVAAVLAATRHGMALTVAVAAAVVLLLAPTVLRHRGRWLHQWIAVWWVYRGRRRHLAATGPDGAWQLLTHVESSVELDQVEIDDQPAVLLTHRGGLSAVLEVDPTEGALLMGAPQALPSPVALLPAADPKTPAVTVQVLIQVTPAPRVRAAAVDRAYRELTGGVVPASRQAWVVLQAPRTPDFHADRELRPALTAAIRRTRRQLRQDRATARLLNRDEVLAAVAHLTHLTGGPVGGGDRPLARENWRNWTVQGTPQSCHRLLDWPGRAWELDPLLRALPAAAAVVSLSVAREDGHPGADDAVVEVAFRLIGADATALATAERALDEAIRGHGGRLQRLDGEHAHGVAATLPFGGFLR
ncbi:type VII secretion protein EccE [Micromonospora sp. WMMD1082]|uniref:type VII secretion protein EccE n=1 Tax=Micromonospora sp. WMMD1082 TaxID=3016104 RepID=UPI002417A152|nr:type VII secretion protein EccE [Micromonospora sp. WMMD1082]MDG4794510.1 type VII secretion protein EccE [Micromonospora sp. WMMD1082]